MHRYLVTLLILCLLAFPAWSASMLYCHVDQTTQTITHSHCCDEEHKHAQGQLAQDCQCDQFQYSQFTATALNLPQAFPKPAKLLQRVATIHSSDYYDLPYRPPIS